ncbi:MAG TPA: GAP family protein [Solirubrobacteraceae bacterium]
MGDVLLLALASAFNPTLLTASTLMMLLPNSKRLMLGYLAGALMTSITLGIVIVFSVEGSGAVSTTKHTLSPVATMTLGAIFLVVALVIRKGEGEAAAARRQERQKRKGDKGPPRWQQALSKGSARTTFVIGALLTLPGASYLAGLTRIDRLNYSTAPTVVLILAFNVVMLALLEIPLLGFVIAPDWTKNAIDRAKTSIGHHWRRVAVTALCVLGGLLVIKGLIELL